MLLPLLQSTDDRMVQIVEHFSIPFCMMSLSYEPIFLMILSQNLKNWMRIERLPFDQRVSIFCSLWINLIVFILLRSICRFQSDSNWKTTIFNEPTRSYPYNNFFIFPFFLAIWNLVIIFREIVQIFPRMLAFFVGKYDYRKLPSAVFRSRCKVSWFGEEHLKCRNSGDRNLAKEKKREIVLIFLCILASLAGK